MRQRLETIFILTAFLLTTHLVSGQNVQADSIRRKEIQTKVHKHIITYPRQAVENGIQGTVTISFDIDSTCSIVNRKVVTGIGYGCDEAALKALDDFQKDMKKDEKSNCNVIIGMTLPLVFKLY